MPKAISKAIIQESTDKTPQEKRGRGRPAGVAGKKIKKIRPEENFQIYIYRILKSNHPKEAGIGSQAMSMMNSILM